MSSLFPQVGSQVVKVLTNKTGTAARIEFDDGSSIYVKYEALLLTDTPRTSQKLSTESVQHRPVVSKPKPQQSRVSSSVLEQRGVTRINTPQDLQALEEKRLRALARTEDRQSRLMEQWDRENPSGEASIH